MKTPRILIILILIFVLFSSCARKNTLLKDRYQQFSPIPETNAELFKAILSEKLGSLIATGRNDNGLMLYDISNLQLTQLNDLKGAGTKFLLDQEEKNVVFISYSLVENRKYQSLFIQNIKDKKIRAITENRRNLKLLSVNSTKVIYLDDDNVMSYEISSIKEPEKYQEKNAVAYSDHELNLTLYYNGEKKILNPSGPGNYIWVSISPDKKNILYNKAGSGTFICDLNGKNIMDLGRINSAKWVGEGKWVVGMDDLDDGHKYIKSDILLFDTDKKTKINLTKNTGLIAMYPAVSESLDELIFNDENGKIYISNLNDHKIR
jgi:hypothetical protein